MARMELWFHSGIDEHAARDGQMWKPSCAALLPIWLNAVWSPTAVLLPCRLYSFGCAGVGDASAPSLRPTPRSQCHVGWQCL